MDDAALKIWLDDVRTTHPQLWKTAFDSANQIYDEVSKFPHFDRDGVRRQYVALGEAQRVKMGVRAALLMAYFNHLLVRGVLREPEHTIN